jgi:hypothetical protein
MRARNRLSLILFLAILLVASLAVVRTYTSNDAWRFVFQNNLWEVHFDRGSIVLDNGPAVGENRRVITENQIRVHQSVSRTIESADRVLAQSDEFLKAMHNGTTLPSELEILPVGHRLSLVSPSPIAAIEYRIHSELVAIASIIIFAGLWSIKTIIRRRDQHSSH